jgi:RNA polymerase sigma-70 factor, ECF subfamily
MPKGIEVSLTGFDRSARCDRDTSDRRLIEKARDGSLDAVEALIDRHWERAHRIAFGIVGDPQAAEDITQEAMLSLADNIGRLDLRRPFVPWFHAIVANRARDWLRGGARRAEISIDPLRPLSEATGSPRQEPDAQAPGPTPGDPDLVAALSSLTPDQRAALVLRFVAGYGPKQIGQMLGIPTGTVGSRLRRTLDQLREALEAGDG